MNRNIKDKDRSGHSINGINEKNTDEGKDGKRVRNSKDLAVQMGRENNQQTKQR